MRVGAGCRRLHVPLDTPMGGYADRTFGATGTLDPIEVHCVAFVSAETAFVLVVVDLVCVNSDLAAAVATAVADRTGVPPAAVWTAATHTHSGPDVNCGTGRRSTPPHWLDVVPAAAVAAAADAVARAHGARVDWHTGVLEGVGARRSDVEAEPVVPVDVLTVRDDRGLAGVLAVVPVHPTVLSSANSLMSGDLSAAIRRSLRAVLDAGAGGSPWVIVATGCAGDISTRSTRAAQTPQELSRLAGRAATQIAATLASTPVGTASPHTPFRWAQRRLRLPVRVDDPAPAGTAPAGSAVADRIAHTLEQGHAVAAERAARHPDGAVELVVSAVELGGLRIIGLGAEPFLRVRDIVERPAIVLGYANDYAGYLPDESGLEHATYETLSSPFRSDAAEIAVRAAEKALSHSDLEEPT